MLYGQAGVQLAEQVLRAGDPRGAVPFFLEAFATAPGQSTRTIALFKEAFLSAADVNYVKRDWKSASEACGEMLKQQYFRLTSAERTEYP